VLAIEHEPGAGPEMFGLWLSDLGVQIDVCRPYAGDVLPERIEQGGLMALGGSMGACDDEDAPWLPRVRTLLAEATARGRPVLGICLGAQMLAVALGGRVQPSRSGGELGLRKIDLNDESQKDPLFVGMSSPAEAAQWHDDEITELPNRAVLLASSATCRVQAFRAGERSWGVQFHPEASGAVMQAWADAERALPPARLKAVELAIEEVAEAEDRLFDQWRAFAERFARILKEA
jgi:GMP synthase-like glutamine amidotransferase